jgi:hypothetical protein
MASEYRLRPSWARRVWDSDGQRQEGLFLRLQGPHAHDTQLLFELQSIFPPLLFYATKTFEERSRFWYMVPQIVIPLPIDFISGLSTISNEQLDLHEVEGRY